MRSLDLLIVATSLIGLILLAGWLARRQKDAADYYLGGRRLSAWALGVSLAANQVSAISLVGAPAFVALREGGGLTWLQYELAVPLAMAALVLWGVPVLRRARGANVYAAIEDRLGPGARRLLAAFFLVGRGLGTGVILYASALVVAALTGWGVAPSLWIVALVAAVYTSLGGLVADVISDVLQFGLLWGGTLLATVVLAVRLAGEGDILGLVERSRLVPLELAGHGLGDGATFALWPMLFGGFFLYLAYYGCDQTQAQRILAASTAAAARKALFLAAMLRFPLVLTYCVFGVLLAAFLAAEPSFAAGLAGKPPDALVPEFVVAYLPAGLLGVGGGRLSGGRALFDRFGPQFDVGRDDGRVFHFRRRDRGPRSRPLGTVRHAGLGRLGCSGWLVALHQRRDGDRDDQSCRQRSVRADACSVSPCLAFQAGGRTLGGRGRTGWRGGQPAACLRSSRRLVALVEPGRLSGGRADRTPGGEAIGGAAPRRSARRGHRDCSRR